MDNDPKHTSKVVAKWVKDNKVKSCPARRAIEHLWAELKKHVRARRPTNPTQLHQLCQEEWAKIHPTYCGKCGVQQVSHQGETRQGLVTDGVYITVRWPGLIGADCGW